MDPRLEFLARHACKRAENAFPGMPVRLLDIGCADRSFINYIKNNGVNIKSADGVDVRSRWFVPGPPEKNENIFIQDLQDGTGDIPLNNYHVITMWEVVEHIENPVRFLRNVKKLLVNGGIVLISSPNLSGLSRYLKGSGWVGVSEQDHKYLFNRLSLNMLLARSGFVCKHAKAYFFPSFKKKFDIFNELLSLMPGGGMLFVEGVNRE